MRIDDAVRTLILHSNDKQIYRYHSRYNQAQSNTSLYEILPANSLVLTSKISFGVGKPLTLISHSIPRRTKNRLNSLMTCSRKIVFAQQ